MTYAYASRRFSAPTPLKGRTLTLPIPVGEVNKGFIPDVWSNQSRSDAFNFSKRGISHSLSLNMNETNTT
jgi:hypothetical protein